MIDVWWSEFVSLLDRLLQHPENQVQWIAFTALAMIALLGAMRLAAGALRVSTLRATNFYAGILVAALVMALGGVAASLYLVPRAACQAWVYAYLYGALGLALVLVAAPLLAAVWRTGYVAALISLVVGIVTVLIVLSVADAVRNAVRAGERDSERVRDRHDRIHRMLKE